MNRSGVRVGKGGGYADLELALLVEAGLVDEATTIVTTVGRLQVLDEELPESAHDFRVDVVVTARGGDPHACATAVAGRHLGRA